MISFSKFCFVYFDKIQFLKCTMVSRRIDIRKVTSIGLLTLRFRNSQRDCPSSKFSGILIYIIIMHCRTFPKLNKKNLWCALYLWKKPSRSIILPTLVESDLFLVNYMEASYQVDICGFYKDV